MGLEGLVSKRRDWPYQAGRSNHWLKIKSRAHPAMTRVMERSGASPVLPDRLKDRLRIAINLRGLDQVQHPSQRRECLRVETAWRALFNADCNSFGKTFAMTFKNATGSWNAALSTCCRRPSPTCAGGCPESLPRSSGARPKAFPGLARAFQAAKVLFRLSELCNRAGMPTSNHHSELRHTHRCVSGDIASSGRKVGADGST
jgi:hypothetical protein